MHIAELDRPSQANEETDDVDRVQVRWVRVDSVHRCGFRAEGRGVRWCRKWLSCFEASTSSTRRTLHGNKKEPSEADIWLKFVTQALVASRSAVNAQVLRKFTLESDGVVKLTLHSARDH